MAYFSLPSDPDSEQTRKALAREFQEHWKKYRRQMYQEMKAEGDLEEASLHKADQMLTMFHNLSGPMGAHQAWYEAWRETANSL